VGIQVSELPWTLKHVSKQISDTLHRYLWLLLTFLWKKLFCDRYPILHLNICAFDCLTCSETCHLNCRKRNNVCCLIRGVEIFLIIVFVFRVHKRSPSVDAIVAQEKTSSSSHISKVLSSSIVSCKLVSSSSGCDLGSRIN
jgi:hypothetical protein